MSEIYHKWNSIADLPDDYLGLSDPLFKNFLKEWWSASEQIKTSLLDEFRNMLNREWAIETGKVERVYHIDDNMTKTLIEQGLNSVELGHQSNGLGEIDPLLIIENHFDVINSLYEDIKRGWPLTPHTVRSLHAAFVENQDFAAGVLPNGKRTRIPLLKGVYKKWPNNPVTKSGAIHQYCPPEHVASEMERLFRMHEQHTEDKVPPDIEAAWLHHRFIQIHPFQDGNGRVARALAAHIYIKAGFFPPVVTAARKDEYIDSLDLADKGDLGQFVRYLSGLVVEKIRQCIDFANNLQYKSTHPPSCD
jgi:Fic family protein